MTDEEIRNRMKQMEVDLIRLDAVTENTAKNLDRLTDIVSRLGERVSGLDEIQKETDETLAILAKAMVNLTETVDRFIRGQHNGDQPH